MITKMHTSYMKNGYIFECKKEDIPIYAEVGKTLDKYDIKYCIEHLKETCNIYKITQN